MGTLDRVAVSWLWEELARRGREEGMWVVEELRLCVFLSASQMKKSFKEELGSAAILQLRGEGSYVGLEVAGIWRLFPFLSALLNAWQPPF